MCSAARRGSVANNASRGANRVQARRRDRGLELSVILSETCRALIFLIALRAMSSLGRGSRLKRRSYSGYVAPCEFPPKKNGAIRRRNSLARESYHGVETPESMDGTSSTPGIMWTVVRRNIRFVDFLFSPPGQFLHESAYKPASHGFPGISPQAPRCSCHRVTWRSRAVSMRLSTPFWPK